MSYATEMPAMTVVLGCAAAAACGLVGAFALMKRTVLAGDVMSHIAIPGLGLAVLWRINPLAGAGLTLFAGILLIWKLGEGGELSTETRVGVLFAVSVALGALLIHSSEELMDALFGGFGKIGAPEIFFGCGASLIVLAGLWWMRHHIVLTLFSADLAAAGGVNVRRANLVFLLLFGLAILAGLRFLGALLVGGLIIVPAAAARQLCRNLERFLLTAVVIAVVAMLCGFTLAARFGLALGPTAVVAASAVFALTLLRRA